MPIPDPDTHQRLLAAARNRTPVVLQQLTPRPGFGLGAFPLWATDGGRHVVAVTWATSGNAATYLVSHLDACTWTVREVGDPVPAIDLAAGPVEVTSRGPRAVIEALALLERFGLEATLGYRKPNEGPKPRLVRRLVCRDNRVVAEDMGKSDARSFLFERVVSVALTDLALAPAWNGAEYVAGGDR